MKSIAILILSIFYSLNTYSCDCKIIKRDSSVIVGLKYSDLVFTGELLESDYENNTFSFVIFEIFKGDYNRDTIWGIVESNCSYFPNNKGIFIVYANKLNDTTIEVSSCLNSISLQRPERVLPPPIHPEFYDNDDTINYLKQRLVTLENRTEGIAMWFADLEKLRIFKKKNQKIKTKNSNNYNNPEINLRDVLSSILIIINIILLFFLNRKKNSSL
jgi:hypothetical protein